MSSAAQDRITRKEKEHEARQLEADRNDLQPESLRRPMPDTTTATDPAPRPVRG